MTAAGVVDRVDVAVYRVPLPAPEADGTMEWDATTVTTVEVRAGDETGLGFTYGSPACGVVVDRTLREVVTGADAFDVPATWASMVRRVRNDGRPGISSMAIAAVDVALWDLKARLLGQSLLDVLGAVRDSVPVYGSGGFTSMSLPDLCSQLAGWVDDGIPRVKMKVATASGAHPDADLVRVEAARHAVGATVDLYVDANGGYARKQAVRQGAEFESLGVMWFEEPVSSDDLEGLHDVRAATTCDVAAGEYGYDTYYFERMCSAGAVDVVQADVSRCAGITGWMHVAAVAAAHGLQLSGHCAQSLHAHVACAIPNVRHLEYFADHAFVDRRLFDGVLEPRRGTLVPDRAAPGHGLAMRPTDAEQFCEWRSCG